MPSLIPELLGDDFINNCRYTYESHEDIEITAFDFDNYCNIHDNYMDSNEVLGFIDNLIN